MAAKRALVVDDSKSARAFLAKLLREQQIEVDGVETAEQAIDYLTQNRPDVIFMDHLMPGMDGFQAVQAIKSNPRTATIPVLMYTSQEGELYLGQARALGAVGVLPKSVGAVDVRTVLQQLHLLDEPEPPTVAAQQEVLDAAVAVAAAVADVPVAAQVPAGPAVDELLREEAAQLRRHVSEAFDAHGRRVIDDVRALLLEVMPPPPEAPPAAEPEKPRHSPVAWLLALAASVAAAVLGTLLWQNGQQLGQLRTDLADARSTVALLTARLGPAPVEAERSVAMAPAAALAPVVARVPFGEAPLAGARVEQLRDFVAAAAALGAKGAVEVRWHAGRFCLAVSDGEYVPAPAATPYLNCDLVADANEPSLRLGEPESTAFANALAELRKAPGAQIAIDVAAGRADELAAHYPEIGGTPARVPTAGEWNTAAEANNRVEMRWRPAAP